MKKPTSEGGRFGGYMAEAAFYIAAIIGLTLFFTWAPSAMWRFIFWVDGVERSGGPKSMAGLAFFWLNERAFALSAAVAVILLAAIAINDPGSFGRSEPPPSQACYGAHDAS